MFSIRQRFLADVNGGTTPDALLRKAKQWGWGLHGQSILEYAVLIAAVATGVSFASHLAYKAFVENAQDVQTKQLVF